MNELFSQGGKGSTGILTNKQAIARKFGVKQSEVVYFSVGTLLTGYKVIYDKVSQRAYSLPADIGSGVTAVSLSAAGVLVHSAGNVDLGELAVAREEFVTLPGSFETGVTVNVKNELVVFTDGKYRWDGELPKIIPSSSTPEMTGGIAPGAWIGVGDASLRNELSLSNGSSLIGVNSEMSLSDFYSSFETVTIKNGDTLTPFSDKVSLRIFAKGGDFFSFTVFPVVPKTRTVNPSTPSGLVSNLNLTSKPYSVTIGGTDYWLLDVDYFDPSKPSLLAFWAEEGTTAPACDASISALLGSFGDCYFDSGVFNFTETISVPEFTRITGAGDTNATSNAGWFRTTQLIYTPSTPSNPAMALAETGVDAYNIHLSDFSISAAGGGLNVSSGIVRRTTGTWSSDFLSRYSIQRVTIYDFASGIDLDHAWLGEMDRVMVKMQIAGTPTGTGITVKRGTSLSARSCFCLGGVTGWRIFTTYSSLISCAADQQMSTAYLLGPGVALYSCGVEAQRAGASLFVASSRTYDDPSAPLYFDPVKIYNASGLMTNGECVAFSDEATYSGSLEAYNCTFEAGDSFVPVRPRGNANYTGTISVHNCNRLVTVSSGVKHLENLSAKMSNVGLQTNSSNVLVNFDSTQSQNIVTKTVAGTGESLICVKVPAGQSADITTSQVPLQLTDAYVTQSNSRLRFNTTYAKNVVQAELRKGSSSLTVQYWSVPSDFASVYVLYKFSGVPAGQKIAIKFTEGSGSIASPSTATSGTQITAISMQ